MAVRPKPVQIPGEVYSMSDESQFRRELEEYLIGLSAEVSAIGTGSDTVSSGASKRSFMIFSGASDVNVD